MKRLLLSLPVLLFFVLCSWRADATALLDTTKKALPFINNSGMSYRVGDSTLTFSEVTAYMKEDKIEEGMKLVRATIKQSLAKQKYNRVFPYPQYEMIDLLLTVNSNELNKDDKWLWYGFVKTIFTRKEAISEKEANKYLKNSANTPFSERIKVLFLVFQKSSLLEKQLEKLLHDQPALVSANILKAQLLYDEKKYKEGILYSSKAIQSLPDYAYAYDLRGKCYAELQEAEKAVKDYNEAVRLFPTYFEFYYHRANALMDQDKYKEAIIDYRHTITVSPNYMWCNYNLARCYRYLNKLDSAVYYIDMHIRDNLDDGDGYNVKGDIYNAKKEYPAAINYYTQAVNLDSTNRRYYEDRADAYFDNKQIDEAKKDYEKAIKIENRPYPNYRLAGCYEQFEDYEKAIAYDLRAIKINPDYKYAYVGLNGIYLKQKNYPEALKACRKAIEIDSTFEIAVGNLGWTYYCTGDYDACISYSYKALKLRSDAVNVMFNIALATLRKGEFEKAKQLYIDFIKTCKQNGYEINDGATDDLRDMIKEKIMTEQATYIIEKIFNEKAESRS